MVPTILRPKTLRGRGRGTAAAGSWMALVAATTLGDAADAVRAEVRADGLTQGVYRLVVQSFDAAAGERPGRNQRPRGSVQRAVTADELRDGVHVSFVEFREGFVPSEGKAPTLLAWIEQGEPDLEFDGRTAKPAPGSMYGVVKRPPDGVVHISLNRKVAA